MTEIFAVKDNLDWSDLVWIGIAWFGLVFDVAVHFGGLT